MNIKYIIAKLIKKSRIPAITFSKISRKAKVNSGSTVVNSTIGKYSFIGNNSTVIHAQIGKFCSIADNCIIGGASHPIDWVSTSPVFHEGRNSLGKNFSEHEYNPYKHTTIGNDVWIGNNVIIKAGVNIENGVIIGMGAIVTKDIPKYEIWAGNPAEKIRDRFPDEDIKHRLENSKWWDESEGKIKKIASEIRDVSSFLSKIEE